MLPEFLKFSTFEIISFFTQTQVEDHEREVLRLTRLLDGERREKEEEAKVFHKKVNMALMIIIGLLMIVEDGLMKKWGSVG